MNENETPLAPEPWSMQPGESDNAFEAFACYRDLGPMRSLAKASRKLGKNLTTLQEWSSLHHWVERARAFDAWRDKEQLEATLELQNETLERAYQLIIGFLHGISPDYLAAHPQFASAFITTIMREGTLRTGKPTERVEAAVDGKLEVSDAREAFQQLMAAIRKQGT